jgi:hypothetical protein
MLDMAELRAEQIASAKRVIRHDAYDFQTPGIVAGV